MKKRKRALTTFFNKRDFKYRPLVIPSTIPEIISFMALSLNDVESCTANRRWQYYVRMLLRLSENHH